MRWATVIENVLKIRKAPTNRAMNGKASREVVREAEVVADVLGVLGGLLGTGAHVHARGERAAQLVLELLRGDAGLGGDLDLIEARPLAEHALGLGEDEVEDRGAAERAQPGDLRR